MHGVDVIPVAATSLAEQKEKTERKERERDTRERKERVRREKSERGREREREREKERLFKLISEKLEASLWRFLAQI